MRTSRVLTSVLIMVLAVGPIVTSGRLHCFRRVRKRGGLCGGLIRQTRFTDAQHCCRWRGVGFADRKVKLGKNRFECTPCSNLLEEPLLSSSPSSSSSSSSLLSTSSSSPSSSSGSSRRRGRESGKISPSPTATTKSSSSTSSTSASTSEYVWPTPQRRDYVMHEYRRPDDGNDVIVWQEWSPCSVTCGAGWKSRARVCDDCDLNDYENVRIQLCMEKFYCPVDGNWGAWRAWGTCSTTCDEGVRTRSRKCHYPPPAYGGAFCPGDGVQYKECNLKHCPVHGDWGAWSEPSACSKSCGQGQAVRTRKCDSPEPWGGGMDCPGSDKDIQSCMVVKCPVDGGWSRWSVWADCSVTCGRGYREQVRTCDNPAPQHGGRDCEGEARVHKKCYTDRPCPVDGGWSKWSGYSKCRAHPCSKGVRVRSRRCASPRPAHGGRRCRGKRYERVECFNYDGCPQNGLWCQWSEWNACLSTCGERTSVRGRQRHCACPPSERGGLECEGESLEIEECRNMQPCPDSDEMEKPRTKVSDPEEVSLGPVFSETTMSDAGPEATPSSPLRAGIPARVRYRIHPPEREITRGERERDQRE